MIDDGVNHSAKGDMRKLITAPLASDSAVLLNQITRIIELQYAQLGDATLAFRFVHGRTTSERNGIRYEKVR
jgi:hypothetical protein